MPDLNPFDPSVLLDLVGAARELLAEGQPEAARELLDGAAERLGLDLGPGELS